MSLKGYESQWFVSQHDWCLEITSPALLRSGSQPEDVWPRKMNEGPTDVTVSFSLHPGAPIIDYKCALGSFGPLTNDSSSGTGFYYFLKVGIVVSVVDLGSRVVIQLSESVIQLS